MFHPAFLKGSIFAFLWRITVERRANSFAILCCQSLGINNSHYVRRFVETRRIHCCILILCSSRAAERLATPASAVVRCCSEYRTHSEQTMAGRPQWAGDTQYLIPCHGFFTRINCEPLTAGRQLLVEQGNGRPERTTQCPPDQVITKRSFDR